MSWTCCCCFHVNCNVLLINPVMDVTCGIMCKNPLTQWMIMSLGLHWWDVLLQFCSAHMLMWHQTRSSSEKLDVKSNRQQIYCGFVAWHRHLKLAGRKHTQRVTNICNLCVSSLRHRCDNNRTNLSELLPVTLNLFLHSPFTRIVVEFKEQQVEGQSSSRGLIYVFWCGWTQTSRGRQHEHVTNGETGNRSSWLVSANISISSHSRLTSSTLTASRPIKSVCADSRNQNSFRTTQTYTSVFFRSI